jgi:hypothetical protein
MQHTAGPAGLRVHGQKATGVRRERFRLTAEPVRLVNQTGDADGVFADIVLQAAQEARGGHVSVLLACDVVLVVSSHERRCRAPFPLATRPLGNRHLQEQVAGGHGRRQDALGKRVVRSQRGRDNLGQLVVALGVGRGLEGGPQARRQLDRPAERCQALVDVLDDGGMLDGRDGARRDRQPRRGRAGVGQRVAGRLGHGGWWMVAVEGCSRDQWFHGGVPSVSLSLSLPLCGWPGRTLSPAVFTGRASTAVLVYGPSPGCCPRPWPWP